MFLNGSQLKKSNLWERGVFAILSVDDPSVAPSTSALARRAPPVISRAIDAR